jgi:hypothetical protein
MPSLSDQMVLKVEAFDVAQKVRHALHQHRILATQTVAVATLRPVEAICAMREDLSGPSDRRTSQAVAERPAESMSVMLPKELATGTEVALADLYGNLLDHSGLHSAQKGFPTTENFGDGCYH